MVYVTVQGDTFDKIAKEHLFSEFRIDQLIAANPHHCGTVIFEAGISITIPEMTEDTSIDDSMPPWRNIDE